MLALPAKPGGFRQRLFHHRGSVDEHLHVGARHLGDQPAGKLLQPALHHVVIVGALRIDRDAPDLAFPCQRERIVGGCIAHAQRDHRSHLGPQALGAAALFGALLHPQHVGVRALAQPLTESLGGLRRGVGMCDAARREADLARLCLQPFFDGLVLPHAHPLPRCDCKGEAKCRNWP